jgi:hypothetical protein
MSIFKKENGALVEYTNPLPADYVAPIEDGATSAHDYAVGAFALVKGVLRKITTAVTSGTAITNANSEVTTVAEQLEELNSDLSALSAKTITIEAGTTDSTGNIRLNDVPSTAKLVTIKGINAYAYEYNNVWYAVLRAISATGDVLPNRAYNSFTVCYID